MAHQVILQEIINGVKITDIFDGLSNVVKMSYQGKPFLRTTSENSIESYQVIDRVGEIYNIPALATEFIIIDINDNVFIPDSSDQLIEYSLKIRAFRPDNETDRIISIGLIETTSNSVKINLPGSGINSVLIGGNFYEKYFPDTFNFVPVVEFQKILILYAKPDNQVFYLAQGIEAIEALEPSYDGLFIARIIVDSAGQVVEIPSKDFKLKEESDWRNVVLEENEQPVTLALPYDSRGSFYLTKSAGVGVITIEGIRKASITSSRKIYFYGGREMLLFNATGDDVIIDSSEASGTDSFFFSDRITPFTIKNDAAVLIKLRGDVIELLPSGSDPDLSGYALKTIKKNLQNNNINYCGFALFGSLESDPVWTVTKITVDPSGSIIKSKSINVMWTSVPF